MPFFNTAQAGPMVIEIPPADGGSITGSIMDCWQTPLEDVGPAGVDKGKGGKYLILPPPRYSGTVPDGVIALRSPTYQGYALLRSILRSGSDADFAKAVEYGKRIAFYPLSAAANPPAPTYLDAADVVFDATIPYDGRFFESLARMIESQPWLERDRAMIDPLRTLGIEKGKAFNPDATMREIMNGAAQEARQWLDMQYEASLLPPFYEGGHWALPAAPGLMDGMQSSFADPNRYPLDGRGTTYAMAFFCPKHSGMGSYYLMATKDNEGRSLDGGSTYRLSVPPHVPVRRSWSATVYDRATHGLVRDMARASRSSQSPGLQVNGDESVDIYFGPAAPFNTEPNWVPTSPQGEFEVLFRFYGPEKVAVREEDLAVTRCGEGLRSRTMTTVQSGPQKIDTRIGTLEFTHDFGNGYPTDATCRRSMTSATFNVPVKRISGRCRPSRSPRGSAASTGSARGRARSSPSCRTRPAAAS